MQSFDSLTPRGKQGRLRALATNALAEYGIGDARVSLLKQTFNTLFRVDTIDGRKFALRVGAAERIHTPETEAVETAWLAALRAETVIPAPLPIANDVGAFVTVATTRDVPEPRTCVLFEWARGRRLSEILDPALTATAGELLARLHEHGSGFEGGRRQPVIVGDNPLVFDLPDRIPRRDPVHGTLFADALDRADAAFAALWASPSHPPHLLHGDFHPNNILGWRRQLTPLDFQDALWGFEIHDVAMTLMSLEPFDDADALAVALRSGYERVRPWPAEDGAMVRDLIGARNLSMLNLGYNLRRPGFDRFVEVRARWLADWMRP